jgi:peptidoglycan/LPS O-acetylase OafA/YrhL
MNQGPARVSSATYRKDIDGLRAIAILSVVLYHAGVPWLRGGFTGVDIFFVISGYLIGGHIFSDMRQGEFSFARFYQRRIKRILPAFYVVLCFTLAAALLLLSPKELVDASKSAIAALFSASNIYFLRYSNYFQASSEFNPLLMTWSLAVEEQFYLVIPLVMLAVAHVRRGFMLPVIAAICILSFLFAWHTVLVAPDKAFYLLPSRAWELGAGVAWAVAEATLNRKLVPARWMQAASIFGVFAMLAPIFFLRSTMPFPGPNAVATVLGTALVIGCPSSWFNRSILSLPWLVFIGKISYSWYLWHWPLMAFLRVASGGPLPPWASAVAIAASFALAVLSYYIVEQPFRASRLAPAPLFLRYACVGLAMTAALTFVWKDHGLPTRFPAMSQEQVEQSSSCMVDYGRSTPDLSPQCFLSNDRTPSMALWGDSHSAALAPALRAQAASRGYHFVQFSKSSCLPLAGIAKYAPQHPSVVGECVQFNQAVLKLIAADAGIHTVMLAARWSDPFLDGNIEPLLSPGPAGPRQRPAASAMAGLFADALAKNIAALQAMGKRVVLIEDVPNFDFDPLCALRAGYIPARRLLASWITRDNHAPGMAPASFADAVERSDQALENTRARFQDVDLINLRPTLCDGNGLCTYMQSGRLLYSDEQHLTAYGAFYALRGVNLPGL